MLAQMLGLIVCIDIDRSRYIGRDADGPCVRVLLEVEEVYGI